MIKAESLGTRSSLYRKAEEKEKGFPVLSWRWKISNVVRSAIETRKGRFDAAAKMIVVFSKDRGFTVFGGDEPQGFRIEYLWASRLPKGQVFDHPGMKNCKVFVLESGEGKAGRWVDERRNLPKDFQTAFGIDFVPPFAIGIETDTDQSNEMVTAFYSEPLPDQKIICVVPSFSGSLLLDKSPHSPPLSCPTGNFQLGDVRHRHTIC